MVKNIFKARRKMRFVFLIYRNEIRTRLLAYRNEVRKFEGMTRRQQPCRALPARLKRGIKQRSRAFDGRVEVTHRNQVI